MVIDSEVTSTSFCMYTGVSGDLEVMYGTL